MSNGIIKLNLIDDSAFSSLNTFHHGTFTKSSHVPQSKLEYIKKFKYITDHIFDHKPVELEINNKMTKNLTTREWRRQFQVIFLLISLMYN